jgi:hypothetical protein
LIPSFGLVLVLGLATVGRAELRTGFSADELAQHGTRGNSQAHARSTQQKITIRDRASGSPLGPSLLLVTPDHGSTGTTVEVMMVCNGLATAAMVNEQLALDTDAGTPGHFGVVTLSLTVPMDADRGRYRVTTSCAQFAAGYRGYGYAGYGYRGCGYGYADDDGYEGHDGYGYDCADDLPSAPFVVDRRRLTFTG